MDVVQGESEEERLESADAADVLAWAAERFAPRLAFATGFGPEGCVLFDLIARLDLDVDVFTLDTGLLFPETRTLWRRLEERYGADHPGRPALADRRRAGAHPRRAALGALARPLLRICARSSRWRGRSPATRPGSAPSAASRPRIARAGPRARARRRATAWSRSTRSPAGRPPACGTTSPATTCPSTPLHAHGYPSIGCLPCTSVAPGEDARAGRWRGQGKTECGLHSRPTEVRRFTDHGRSGVMTHDPGRRAAGAPRWHAGRSLRVRIRPGPPPRARRIAAAYRARRARAGRPRADRDGRRQPAHGLPGLGRLRERARPSCASRDGTVWPLPLTLAVDPDDARRRCAWARRRRSRTRPAASGA